MIDSVSSNTVMKQLMADMTKLRAEAMQKDVLPNKIDNTFNQSLGTQSITQPITQKTNFGEVFNTVIQEVNTLQQESGELKTAYELGEPNVDIAQVMIASEKAKIGFTAMVEVRNKFVEAYRDVMNMSV